MADTDNGLSEESSRIAKQLGRKGGNATLKKHGNEHFKRIINLRWKRHREAKKEQESQKT